MQADAVVAVVENDAAMLKAIGRLLRASGIATSLYPSAEAFLAREARAPVACLVLDIALGGMSGIDLQACLTATGVAPPIIFVTCQADQHYELRARAQGCLAYLRKPFASGALLQALGLANHTSAA